jgi:hypothetical protein
VHSKSQRLQSIKTGTTAENEPEGDTSGVSKEYILLKIHNTWLIICCCPLQLLLAAANTTKTATVLRKKYALGHQSNLGQSVQVRNVNINTTDMFLAFTMMQQIMTVLWS